MESKSRSLIKALSWQTLGFISTMIVTFCFMGSLIQACTMTIFMTIIALVLYFVHERFWQRIQWGKLY